MLTKEKQITIIIITLKTSRKIKSSISENKCREKVSSRTTPWGTKKPMILGNLKPISWSNWCPYHSTTLKKAQRYRVQKEQNNIQRYKHDGQIYSLVRFKPLLCYTQAKNIVVKCFLLSINDPAQSTFTCKMNGDRYFIHETFVLITLLKNYVYFKNFNSGF